MSQIEITVLKQGTKHENVISIAFFTMRDAYRSFDLYKKDLQNFLKYIKNLPDFEIRIYTDNTGQEFALKVTEDMPDVSVIHYDCPEFRDGDGHIGTFGTIVRFLPLFEKGLETVWISDIDVSSVFFLPDLLSSMKKNNVDIFIDSGLCYNLRPGTEVKHPVVAHKFISKFKFSKQLLTNFLQRIIDGKYDDLIQKLNKFNNKYTYRPQNKKFPYGMDETFMNGPIYSSMKRNDLKIFVHKNYFAMNFIIYLIEGMPKTEIDLLKKYDEKPTLPLFNKAKEIHQKYIPRLLNRYPCMTEFLEIADRLKDSFKIYLLVDSKDI